MDPAPDKPTPAPPAPETKPAPEVPAPPAPPTPEAEPTTPEQFRERAVAYLKKVNAEAAPDNDDTSAAKPAAPAPSNDSEKKADAQGKKPESVSERLAMLSQEQRRFRAEQERTKAEIREKEEFIRRREAEVDAVYRAKQSADPIGALQALGFTYEQATDQILGKFKPTAREVKEEKKADPELAAMRKELSELRAFREAEVQERAEREYLDGMRQYASANAERFQLTHKSDRALRAAVEWTKRYVTENGHLPGENLEEAMAEALAHIEREREELLFEEGVLTSPKVQQRLSPAAPSEQHPGPKRTTARQSPQTLTNTLAAAAPPRTAPDEPRTPEEYQARAAAVLRGS